MGINTYKENNLSKQDWEQNNLLRLFPDEKILWEGAISVLDVGCGVSFKSKYIPANIHVGVDIYEEYFKHIEAPIPYVVIKYDIRKLKDIFISKSFDLVIALDVIEHLNKEDAISMINQCEVIAKKAVILETPKGFIPQNIDILGYGGHKYQTHYSGWEEKELNDLGYKTFIRDYMMQSVKRHTAIEVEPRIQLIDAIKYV